MENLEIYNKHRTPPGNALRPIEAGRLKGKTDINPMWRIQALTEMFGPAGIGWKAPIKKMWIEHGPGEEAACFLELELFIKVDGVWSEGISGIGGNMFVASERNGLHVNDECYKMCYTDALGVACKSLGIGADVYWANPSTKYTSDKDGPICPQCGKPMRKGVSLYGKKYYPDEFIDAFGCCGECYKKQMANARAGE